MTDEAAHASCVLAGTAGVLLRGASGSGKSGLGWRIVEEAQARGWLGLHVADDRVHLRPRNGRLIASCPPPIAGLWELRGEGIVKVAWETRAVIRLVVDLLPAAEIDRLPDVNERNVRLHGIDLARLALPYGVEGGGVLRILRALERLQDAGCGALVAASLGMESHL